jgi:hypothetical protein
VHLITCIHQNLQFHGFVDDFRGWPFSSYQAILSRQATRLRRNETLDWFGGREGFPDCHGAGVELQPVASLVLEEDHRASRRHSRAASHWRRGSGSERSV